MTVNTYFNAQTGSYDTAPVNAIGVGTTNAATKVDGRVFPSTYGSDKQLMVVCSFAGNEFSPDKTTTCKFYDKSQYRHCCMWFCDTIDIGACGKEGDKDGS